MSVNTTKHEPVCLGYVCVLVCNSLTNTEDSEPQ
jgi:hypothetical protein